MNSLSQVEYRGYTTYEIDSLTNSGQAAACGHGSGREGAYNWIDNWYDKLGFTMNGNFHSKPSAEVRNRLLFEHIKA